MTKPNFFILGAPKCGTTALAQWLGEHPNIYMPPVKEPHYYSHDLNNRQTRTQKAYERLFKGVTTEHQAIGEASVWYLYSREAVSNILAEIPDAQFVVCLRNPVEMAYSLHGQQLVSTNEQFKKFEEAWQLQRERARGEQVPALCEDPQLLLYGPACELGKQLQRLYASCEPGKVHVLFLDDIKKDARAVYLRVLEFLGVEDDGRTQFPVVNSARRRRSYALANGVKRINHLRRKLGIPRLGTGLMLAINRLNGKRSQRNNMSDSTRRMLIEHFASDIEKIENLTGRNLDSWKYMDCTASYPTHQKMLMGRYE